MKISAKIVCFVLCLVLMLPLVMSCTGGDVSSDTVDLGADNGGVVIGGDDMSDDATQDSYTPSGKKYDGADFVVLVTGQDSAMVNCFEYAEEAQTVLDSAVQKKNAAVEAEYDVKFSIVEELGKKDAGLTKMTTAKNADQLEYHLSYVEVYSVVKLATQNVLYDLRSLDGVNLDNSWWDQKANEDLSIGGLQFFTTGDIDIYDDMQQFIVMFNRSLFSKKITDMTVEDLYNTVGEGKWTYDMFYTLGKGLVEDNGDQVMNKDDTYGMLTWDDTIYAVFSSGGSKIVSNDNDTLTLSIIGDESAIARMTEYTEWTKDNAWSYSRVSGEAGKDMFSQDRALFFMGRLSSLNNFREMDSDFGVIPVPKYKEDQESYYVGTSTYHYSMVCTLNLATDIEMRGDVIESCAYWSAQYLTPAYQEKTLEGTNIRDDGSLQTLKIVAANRIYDIGFFIQPGRINAELIYLYRAWETAYASKYESVRTKAESDIEDVVAAYEDLADAWK